MTVFWTGQRVPLRGHATQLATYLWAGLVAVGALVLYLRTMSPTVATVFDDSLEFALVAWRWAVPHPTGYPLYAVLIGLAAHLVPIGEVAWRVSLVSALAGAATVGLTVLLGRALGLSLLGAFWAALVLATAETFWAQARIAEVYTLHLLLTVLLLLCLLRSHADSPALALRGAALAFGLGLAHHRTILLWVPAILLYLALSATVQAHLRREWPRLLLLTLAPLAFYAYLPLRGYVGSLDGTYQNTLTGFVRWVTASAYTVFLSENPFGQVRDAGFYWTLFTAQLSPAALLLAAGGLLWARRRPREVTLLVVGAAANALFAASYRVGDPEVFWLPVVLVAALLSGAGLHLLFEAVSRQWPRPLVPVVVLFALLLAGHVPRWEATFRRVDLSGAWAAADFAQDALSQPLPERAVIVGILGEMTLLRYWQEVHGLRPDVRTIAADAETDRLAAVEEALARGERPFLTRPLPGAERWSLDAVGPLIAVEGAPPEPPSPHQVEVAPGLRVGIRVEPLDGIGPARQRVTLIWFVERPPNDALKTSLRLRNGAGVWLAQVDCVPVHDAYPSTAWKAGERIVDVVDLPALPEATEIEVVVYRAANGTPLASMTVPALRPTGGPFDPASGTCAPAYRLR